MSVNPQIAAPGSSTYDSNTLHVDDGTWDSERNIFLLPNLQGLNFATMQYNGMGNRFKDNLQYHTLIKGHGVLAAITFLGIVPLAIFAARFWWRNPQFALRLHAWLQILTTLTSTVVLVLGYFAVGPKRSLSNPHHGIGVAIYVLILFQAIFGLIVRKLEKGRVVWRISIKLMLHQWLGRAIALLAIVQIPLGLTLYGSPKILFILYTLWMVLLVALWFAFTHRYQPGTGDDGTTSYFTNSDGTRTDITHSRRSRSHHGGGLVKTAAGVGLVGAALGFLNRRKSQKTEVTNTEVTDNRPHGAHHGHQASHGTSYTGSSFVDEKTSISDHRDKHTWRDRILTVGGLAAAFGLGKKFFGKKEQVAHSEYSDYSSGYGPHTASRTELSRLEEGHGPVTPGRARHSEEHITTVAAPGAAVAAGAALGSPSRVQRQRIRRSGGSITSRSESENYYSPGQEKRKSHGLRNSIAAMGVAGFIKHKLGQRNRRQEDVHVEEIKETDRIQEERMRRRQSQTGTGRLTGDGRMRRHDSFSASDMNSIQNSLPATSRPGLTRPLAGAAAGGAAAAALSGGRHHVDRTRIDERHDIHDSMSSLAPPPPIGGGYHGSHSSGSYDSHTNNNFASGAAAGAAIDAAAHHRSSVNSPPLSIKMRMRDDNGRQHVTLRRLSPAEAAAEREAVRRQRGAGRGRSNSLSSIGGDTGDERWRRTEAIERQQDEEMRASRQSLPQQQHNVLPPPPPLPGSSPTSFDTAHLPPPPPITGSGMYDTGESAAGSRADSNRRRRRAERATREQQGARVGNRVEFS